jgi:dihydropteroate synthase
MVGMPQHGARASRDHHRCIAGSSFFCTAYDAYGSSGGPLLSKPIVVGILNVTPDSFSDGGRFRAIDNAVAHADRMIYEGADVIDIGGESTRPQGAQPVDESEELARILPVFERVQRLHPAVPLSVDTSKSKVAREAVNAGARIVNDVSGLRFDPRMGEAVAELDVGLVVMHSRGGVSDMATFAHATYQSDVVSEVTVELGQSIDRARSTGIAVETIVVDPGIGFSKRSEHSLAVLRGIPRLLELGFPLMIGASRKRFIGELTGVSVPSERTHGTVGANVAALMLGARLFRVHDVRAHREALDVAWTILETGRRVSIPDPRAPTPDLR